MTDPFLICRVGLGAAPVVVGNPEGYPSARLAEAALFELAVAHERKASEQGGAARPAWLEAHKIITRAELARRAKRGKRVA